MSPLPENRYRSIAALSLVLLAVLLLLALVLTVTPTSGTTDWLLAPPPALLAIGVLVIGVRVARGELVAAPDAPRVAGWAGGGTGIFLAVAGWLLVLETVIGASIPHLGVVSATTAALGAFVGSVLGIYDAQNRAQARTLREHEAELEAQNERLEQFASVVSHDLRNPLTVAQGRLDLAREEAGEAGHLRAIADSLDRMETLIEDLLVLARGAEDVDASEEVALEGAVRQAWAQVPTNGGSLAVEVGGRVHADESRLVELFENLFRNAVEHGGSAVTVRVRPIAGGFAVADGGPGIPSDERESVLKAGVTANGSDGSGLGLYIVSVIAQAHGWSVAVTESESGGARFEFTGLETSPDDSGTGQPDVDPDPVEPAETIAT